MIGQQVEIAAQDAAITVVDGEIQTTPSVTGQAMDLTGIGALEARIGELTNAAEADAGLADGDPHAGHPRRDDALAQEVAPLLQNEITVRLWDPIKDERLAWTTSPADLGHWISFARPMTGRSPGTSTRTP